MLALLPRWAYPRSRFSWGLELIERKRFSILAIAQKRHIGELEMGLALKSLVMVLGASARFRSSYNVVRKRVQGLSSWLATSGFRPQVVVQWLSSRTRAQEYGGLLVRMSLSRLSGA